MGNLIYAAIASLDGYVADASGNFDWAAPDEEVHAFVNDLERPIGTYLYGRRMYETMAVWETMATEAANPAVRDYAEIWRAADKVVYSSTLAGVSTARTRLERRFDVAAVAAMKAAATRNMSVGGADLGGQALRAGLVDEIQVFLTPVVVGGGTHWAPSDVFARCELLDHRRFTNGTVYVRYAVTAR